MKIERLTDNKIRIIIHTYDLELENININNLTVTTIEEQSFFIKILEKAEKEIDFETAGSKLLLKNIHLKKKPLVKRKIPSVSDTILIYKFDDFEEFCM